MKELLRVAQQLLAEVTLLRKAIDENTEQLRKNQPATWYFPNTLTSTAAGNYTTYPAFPTGWSTVPPQDE